MYNLENPCISYLIGLLQTDGHHSALTRNRGRVILEIGDKDKDIILKISNLLTTNYSIKTRERYTNFSKNKKKKYIRITICDYEFRKWLINYVPTGKKSKIIEPPSCKFSKYDYWRGIIDGDGSVGVSAKEYPFIGLVSDSDKLVFAYISLIKEITGQDKVMNRNKRDNIYNITVFRENAQSIISKLYYKNCIGMNRKKAKAKEALLWERPKSLIKKPPSKKWDKKQDDFILNHTKQESMDFLKRSKFSINTRLWKIKSKKSKFFQQKEKIEV